MAVISQKWSAISSGANPGAAPGRSRAAKLWADFERMAANRSNHEGLWEDTNRYFLPSHSGTFSYHGISAAAQMNRRNDYVLDSTPITALKRCSAILQSLVTPRESAYHRLKPSEPGLLNIRRVAAWFEDTNERILKLRQDTDAGFEGQNGQYMTSIACFGTAEMFIDPRRDRRGPRYKCVHLREGVIAESHEGVVNAVHRVFELTARQASEVPQFEGKLPDTIAKALEHAPDKMFRFLHCVVPRDQVDRRRKDYAGMPFASYYVSEMGPTLLSEGGYRTFPYAVSRFEQAPGECYGRGMAGDALPAAKTLMEVMRAILKQGHRTVDPVILTNNDGVLSSGFNARPGAINAGGVSRDGKLMVQTMPVGQLAAGFEILELVRRQINDALLVELYRLLEETREMTATEVIERLREKAVLLAPSIGRLQSEYLGALIPREVDIALQLGLLLPMPPELINSGSGYEIEYDSPISRTQQAEALGGIVRTYEFANSVASVTQDPSIYDAINGDRAIQRAARINAVPIEILNSPEEMEGIRQGRAQAAQQEQQAAAAPGAAAMINAATKARSAP